MAAALNALPDHLRHELAAQPAPAAWWVALSGGADSTALLHAAWSIRDALGAPLHALHVDHGLHSEATAWRAHCDELCRKRGIPLSVVTVDARPAARLGPEASARAARYEAFAATLGPGEVLLLGHHADDQAETLLLHLLRGSGVDGLAGMPRRRRLGHGHILRPLLALPGQALRDWLDSEGVDWVDDPSNADDRFDRNYLRQHVLPLLERRFPHTIERLGRSARLLDEAAVELARQAEDWIERMETAPGCLDQQRFIEASPFLQRVILRRWLAHAEAPPVPERRLREFVRQLAEARPERRVRLEWVDWSLERRDQQLRLRAPPGS